MSESQNTQTRVSLPTKNVDAGKTVTERMTDNAVENILPARYLDKDSNGNVTETVPEMFERVAANVAQAERLYTERSDDAAYNISKQDFEHQMKTLKFMPNSPTLMNAGLDIQQLSACISGDTPIYTTGGLKQMRDIQEGDKVLTHTGSFKEVTAHWSNGEKETMDVKRGTSRGDNYSVTATPDHEFLTEDGEWKELRETDSAMQPKASPDVSVPDSFNLTNYTAVMGKDKNVISDGGTLLVENSDDPRTGEYDQQYSEIVASVENTEQFAYLAGAYLAEGDVDGSDVRFTIGSDENEFEDRIVTALGELFDVHVAVMESNYGNWKTITASSAFIADLFITQFGTGSTKKRIPEWVFATNTTYQKSVLDGILDGDSHKYESGWKLTLANPTLAYESSLLARNCGYDVNFTFDAANELSENPTSRVNISNSEGKTYMNTVTKRDSGTQEVFDMEVAGDHSFVAGDFVVHNCFVLEPQDDMGDILDTAKDAGLIFKSGGGVGYTFSHLRPRGTMVQSTKGTSSGPVSFMRLYDEVCQQVKQGGTRRGAQMAIMRVDHPDIGRFISAKREEGEFANFNISVGVTDQFKDALSRDGLYQLNDPQADFELGFERLSETYRFYHPDYADVDGIDSIWEYGESVETDTGETLAEKWKTAVNWDDILSGTMQLPARFIWDIIVDGAWRNGEPGLFDVDETNAEHSFDIDEHPEHEIHATNPCAEQPLSNYEACNLGHVNLSLFKSESAPRFGQFDGSIDAYFEKAIDIDSLNETIRTGVRFLDNVAEMSDFPLTEIEETVDNLRKIGLGVMGWAHLLYQCGIEYGSDTSLLFANRVMNHIDRVATEESHQLGKERGNFGAWEDSKYANPEEHHEWFVKHVHKDPADYPDGYAMRNHNVTTVAPTGTTSMLADTSGGIEPVYDVAYQKQVGSDIGDLMEFDSYFEFVLEESDAIDAEAAKDEAADLIESGAYDSPADISEVPDEIADIFVTTEDVSPEAHTLMQRAFQQAVDSGISKTVNLPTEATREDVSDAYVLGLSKYELGSPIKGMTVYRDQSRQDQVMTTQEHSEKELEKAIQKLEQNGYTVTEE